ncbi:pericentriolar material 1 protein-like isoform X2 [Biomphalaria glabrata]|uniref:Pericentriolar material 1 protein-like isoform X2 n=1 Tax=Biomphalaria glabrata TaxID=6526 RepID=A0A9W3B2T5_BIOGL|nr:pericentriolar material 1 protein-like isoform X2 [Biomphalaria glabrata]
MASGGYQPNKQGKTEPRRRSNWQRSISSDRDDAQSLNSLPTSDIRINNWDLSDLRPTNLGADSKRRKKSKGNPEREREQSLSLDAPSHEKKHTPTSYSRTKVTANTPTSQRVALENLRQHMTFSDLDDQVSTDGERNNERQLSQGRRPLQNTSLNRTEPESDPRGQRKRRVNQNNNMDYSSHEPQGPQTDSNEIAARLLQIREFMKQAKSMLSSLEKLGDRKKAEDVEKVRRLMRNLQEQEVGYRSLLQNSLTLRDDHSNEASRGDNDAVNKDDGKDDSEDDTSVDLDVKSENSESSENSQDSRPRIESKLGIEEEDLGDGGERLADNDDQYAEPIRELVASGSGNSNANRAVENEMPRQGQFSAQSLPIQESADGLRGPTEVMVDDPTPQHQELLRILREKQQQLQALMSRQEELNMKRRETEKKLLEAQARDNKARAALAAVSSGRQFVESRLSLTREAQAVLAEAEWGSPAEEDDEEKDVSEDGRVLKSNIVGYPVSDDEDNSKVDTLPNELVELKRQLNYLKNEFSQVSEAQKNVESEPLSLPEGQQQLQNKLRELQDKKSRMDALLHELQLLQSQPMDNLRNNESNPLASQISPSLVASNIPAAGQQSQTSVRSQVPVTLQGWMNEMPALAAAAAESSNYASTSKDTGKKHDQGNTQQELVSEVQEKLKRLKEVRGQLDELRKLVQYYQGENQDGDPDDQSSLPGFSDAGDQTSSSKDQGRLLGATGMRVPPQQQQSQQQLLDLLQMSQQQKLQAAEGGGGAATRTSSSSLQNMVQLLNLAGTDQGDELSDEDNVSVSQSDSQWSHIGPAWDEDPEIREKVRKLKAAKEKLRQLQDLVSFVQQSPDGSRAMPENLSDLVAIVEGEAVTQATQTEETNVSVSEGEVASDSHKLQQRQEAEGNENPREELERLKKERKMLLDIQNQLQHIQTQVGRPSTEQERNVQERQRQESNPNLVNGGQEQSSTAPVVTFASNDELYSKMRRQRILREELRAKKKELEALMKKDRNKRQYSRNQDNQSDTVSLNTDTFGVPASVDATMATWGGSTVDNLENITEDEDAQKRIERVDGDEDDGYPSDGIVQVEEEEEENDSDNETYTIEADAKQRRTLRKGINNNSGARPKTSRGRQSFPQPVYGAKETTKKQINGQRSQRSQRVSKHRQEDDDDEDDDADSREKTSEWFSLINERLKELAGSVESLRKPESEHRQLSVSLNQDSGQQTGTLYSPMQEQMLQLQNQSMMLSFGQLIQSLTRQQTEMQQLQQQMQALQLQMNEIHDQSYHNVASQSQQYLRPAMCNPSLNNSTYNLQAPSQPLVINQQLSSPYLQGHLNSTATNGLFGGYLSPGLRNIHQTNLPASGLAANADGAAFGGLGSGLSINTGSGSSLAQPNAVTGFIFNPLGQTSLTRHLSPHVDPLSQQSSVSTMTRDFSQFVNTLNSPSASQGAAYGQFNNLHLFGSSSQQQQTGVIPSQLTADRPVEDLAQGNANHLNATNKKRKYRKISSRSESNTSSNLKLSRENVQNLSTRSSTASQNWASHRSAQYTGATAGTQYDMAAGQALRDDCRSSCSSIQSIRDQHSRLKEEQSQTASVDAADDSNTLFDTLRDTIYSEVASLISQNESRPHFLLEIFREMQQIDSDLQRQRALYSIQEILRSHIEANGGAPTQNLSEAERTSAGRKVARGGAPRNYSFDYAEVAENPSSLSTPTNDCEESPFFQDALGETVIEFDSLRHEDREEHLTGWRNCGTYEQQMWENGGFLPFDKFRESHRKSQSSLHKTLKEETQSSASQSADLEELAAGEEGASAYVSDMPYPRINMKQLDKQIKEVMMETIPLVKQHMSDVCSTQLLNYIKQLVLSLTSQVGHEEFAKFFQRQLSSILQDTLQKYHGRKMRECGEDLLVEISDVLFNELAFFRLMQDLEDGSAGDRVRLTEWTGQYPTEVSKSSSTYSNDGSGSSEAEDDDKDEDTKNNEEDNETNLRDSEDKEDIEMESYQIELAPSETKPFTRIGSDEDDDEGDEEQSMDDPSETAVSRDSRMEVNGHTQPCVPSSARPETEGAGGDVAEKQDAEKLSPKKVVSTIVLKATGAGDQGETQPQTQVNGSVTPNDGHNEEGELTVDDLPERLTVDSEANNTPGLRWNYEEEQRSVYGIDAIISSLDDVNELAGEDNLDPESFQS